MVNTVVVVHNGDYTKILKNYSAKLEALESKIEASAQRYENLESKVDALSNILPADQSNN